MDKNKKDAFQHEMILISDKAKKECNYNPSRFLMMVEKDGGGKLQKNWLIIKNYLMDL